MHAIDESLLFRLKRFGGRDIREDHEFLDKAVRIEPWRCRDGFHGALLVQDDFAFREIEIEWPAFVARDFEGAIGLVKRNEDRSMKQRRPLVRSVVERRLRLAIGEFRRRAHNDPMEAMAELVAVASDHDTGGERRAILVWAQRAEIVGNPLRQHGHDAVGEIDRIAAIPRLFVECAARGHVSGDISDSDAQNIAAGIGWIGVMLGMHRVVMVLGVFGIDGHERDGAPILAM